MRADGSEDRGFIHTTKGIVILRTKAGIYQEVELMRQSKTGAAFARLNRNSYLRLTANGCTSSANYTWDEIIAGDDCSIGYSQTGVVIVTVAK